eukprot:GILI01019944.1.p1 GENE.GILI01019944.1~~GILI01019944.1.p1  ORF type:complete len:265 (+),score=49.02 GILI01019944.1:83-877(+)
MLRKPKATAAGVTGTSEAVSENDLQRTIQFSSMLLWIPHVLACAYVTLGLSFSHAIVVWGLIPCVIAGTYFTGTRLDGDWLMALAATIGLCGEVFGLGSTSIHNTFELSRNIWIAVSAAHGIIGGILCKAKDMEDGRYFAHHTISERLYVVIPFTIGQWTGFILMNGWQGLFKAFSSIFLCLATVGYGVVTYRLASYFGVTEGDVLLLVTKVFTTSFGAVFGGLAITVCFVIYLAIPFLDALLSMNAIVSSVGIVMEVLLYDLA